MTTTDTTHEIIEVSGRQVITPGQKQSEIDRIWWQLFDLPGAVAALDDHLAALGSDRYEQHTRKAYESALRYFINWAGMNLPAGELRGMTVYELIAKYPTHRFPGPGLVTEFIAHMKRRGRAKSTIDRYMAPVRIYVKALRKQYIPAKGDARQIVDDCKHFMEMALDEKVPESETFNNMPPMYQHGERLSVAQVDAIFKALLAEPGLAGARDLALMYLGFNAALREAELARLTLSNIKQGADTLEMHVRGKRNNRQPVPLDATGHALLMRWVEMYNAAFDEGDPRRIGAKNADGDEVVIFQSLRPGNGGGGVKEIGVDYGFDPYRGLGNGSLWRIVKRRSRAVLGFEISVHDMRRTAAFLGRQAGMEYDDLQMLLRHASIATTRRYVGNPPDMRKSLLSNRVTWSVSVA